MAGHNKWSTIKRHKKLTDDKKSKKFSIYSKEISNACIQYGVDPKVNFKLRNLINKAKLINMPNDKIEKAINRTNINFNDSIDYINYEAYGPCGVGFIIVAINNNKNNINFLLKNIFKKYKGHVVNSGEVIFNFNKKTKVIFNKNLINEKKYNELKLKKEILFFDNNVKENHYEVLIENKDMKIVNNILKKEKISLFKVINNFFIPKYFIYINKDNFFNLIVKLKNELKDIKYIQNIFSNEKIQ